MSIAAMPTSNHRTRTIALAAVAFLIAIVITVTLGFTLGGSSATSTSAHQSHPARVARSSQCKIGQAC